MVEDSVILMSMYDYIEQYGNKLQIKDYCKSCGMYGKLWTCPPHIEEVDFSEYSKIALIFSKIPIKREMLINSLEEIELLIVNERRNLDEKLLRKEQEYAGRAFFPGHCIICGKDKCSRLKAEPCRHVTLARTSLESHGFDIISSAKKLANIDIHWYDGHTVPEYITLVSAIAYSDNYNFIW